MSTAIPNSRKRMTCRQRVNAALEGRDHDRVPRHESFWRDTLVRWRREGHLAGGLAEDQLPGDELAGDELRGAALELLQSDFAGLCWIWPRPFGGDVVLEEDAETRVVRDGHGKTVRLWKHRMGTPEHLGFGCTCRADWETTYKPLLLKAGVRLDVEDIVRRARQADERGQWTFLAGIEGFEATRALLGDEISLMAMCEDPDWLRDVADTVVDLSIQGYQRILDAGVRPDGLWTYGDMAYNHATMCSPAMYKELLWPGHKRLADFAHRNGMKFIFHTDGDVNGVLDLYLAAGFDCLQPLEAKANMDIRNLCPRYGDRLTFFGNIDVMVMAANDRERLEHEVRTKLAAGMATKRYIYHSDHSVPPGCDFATWKFVIELLDRYGWY